MFNNMIHLNSEVKNFTKFCFERLDTNKSNIYFCLHKFLVRSGARMRFALMI